MNTYVGRVRRQAHAVRANVALTVPCQVLDNKDTGVFVCIHVHETHTEKNKTALLYYSSTTAAVMQKQ